MTAAVDPRRHAPWLKEVVGGGIGSVVTLAVVLTLGLLAVAPLGAAAAPLGLSAAFVTVSIGGVAFALLGRSAMPVTGPSSATVLIVAGLLAELARDPAIAGGAHGLGLAMSAIGCTVALAGLTQIALGASRLGRLAQFVPQPVLAGFMNGVALLIVASQLPALLGLHDASLASLLDPAGWHPRTLAIGLATAGCTWLLAWRWPRSPHQLIGLGFGIALYALAVALKPDDPPSAQIGPLPPGLLWPALPQRLGEAGAAAFLLRHASAIVATAAMLALIGTLESVLNALAIDQQLGTDHDSSRELLMLGVTNLVVGLFCGLPAVMLRVRAQATLNAGGAGRRAALAGAVVFALMGLLLGPALALLPKVVLAGIMLTVAFALLDSWTRQLLDQWRNGERSADLQQSLATVGIVCAVTLWKGFAVAVAVGTALTLMQFVRAMNRSLLRSICTAIEQPSRRLYPPAQEAALQTLRPRIAVIELEGALFFGSAGRLAHEVRAVDADFVVLDLSAVTTIDASGATLLQRLSTQLQQRGVGLLLAGVSAAHRHGRQLRAFGCFRSDPREDWHPDADRAVEFAECRLLERAGLPLSDTALAPESSTLFRGLDAAQAATLRAAMRPRTLAAGELLFRQGDPADGLYLLTRGSITITAGSSADPAQRRYVSFSAGHVLGETAMLDGGTRSARATADGPAELLQLCTETLDDLGRHEPALASRVHRNIAIHLSERLRLATTLRQIAPVSGR